MRCIMIGTGGKAAPLEQAFTARGKPVLKARMVPRQDKRWLGVLPVIAFAGIAGSGEILRDARRITARASSPSTLSAIITATRAAQAAALLKEADERNAMLVTTEKDFVRLPDEDGTRARRTQAFRSRPFSIAIEFEDEAAVKALLATALANS